MEPPVLPRVDGFVKVHLSFCKRRRYIYLFCFALRPPEFARCRPCGGRHAAELEGFVAEYKRKFIQEPPSYSYVAKRHEALLSLLHPE